MVEHAPIFEEVTEAEYNAIAIKNMREDNFIVDDNGEGYVDNGLEDWDNVSQDESTSDEEDFDDKSMLYLLTSNQKNENERKTLKRIKTLFQTCFPNNKQIRIVNQNR